MAEGSVLDWPPLLEEVCVGQSCVTDPQAVNNRVFFSCESSEMEGMLSFNEGVPDVCFESDKLVCGTLVIPETALEFGQDLVFLKMMNEALVYCVYAFILDTLCEGVEE